MRIEKVKKIYALFVVSIWTIFYIYSDLIDNVFLKVISLHLFDLTFLKYFMWLVLLGIISMPFAILECIQKERIRFF